MHTIIVALDGSELSERAVDIGCTLARTFGATLELVTVLEEPVLLDLLPSLMLPDKLTAERYLAEVAARLPEDVAVRSYALRGNPVDELLNLTRGAPDTLLVMSTHGRGGLGRVMFGSVADKVMRGATIPVVLVRGDAVKTPGDANVLVPLDGSELAEQALPLAIDLAARAEGVVHLLRVAPSFWSAPYVAYAPEAMYLDPRQIEELTAEAQEDARAYLDRVAADVRAKGVRVTWEVRVGRAADEIVRAIETIAPDLVVMSTHGRGGLRRWALGSIADDVLHRGTHPILIIPPHAHVAPAVAEATAKA